MDLILITNDPGRAAAAAQSGVDRIMVDLEFEGKRARQGHRATVISGHALSDVAPVRRAAAGTALLVRTDPWPFARNQVEACIEAGADILMLPMFTGPEAVAGFVAAVGGRARTCLLLETSSALAALEEILAVAGVDEIHVGLNDLHLALGKRFMFELLADGTVESIGFKVLERGIKFGFGGVARIGGGPLSPELVLSEHVRLGSSQVILSRDFQRVFDESGTDARLASEIRAVRSVLEALYAAPVARLEANRSALHRMVGEIVATHR